VPQPEMKRFIAKTLKNIGGWRKAMVKRIKMKYELRVKANEMG
jgi:hypothetical protein